MEYFNHVAGVGDVPMTPEQIALRIAEEAKPPVAPSKNILFKSTFIRRMSGPEATVMEQELVDANAWFRLLYNSLDYFDTRDAMVQYLHALLESHWGTAKADFLLEPEA